MGSRFQDNDKTKCFEDTDSVRVGFVFVVGEMWGLMRARRGLALLEVRVYLLFEHEHYPVPYSLLTSCTELLIPHISHNK